MQTRFETHSFTFARRKPLVLQGGAHLSPVTLAYEKYGQLSPAKDNVILLFHALSGGAHAAGWNPDGPGSVSLWTEECHAGWWDGFIGPGRALDTQHYCVLCINYLGGCYGSTGPASENPETGRPYGSSFPWITSNDLVDSQLALLDHLGIQRLHAAVGGSLGGMLALNLAVRYPERVGTVIPIAAGLAVTTLQRVMILEQACAIQADKAFRGGNYYGQPPPLQGMALARMISHKSFISLQTLSERARDEVIADTPETPGRYRICHPVESYMLHQGRKFAQRFDANTYLRILNAWRHYELPGGKDAFAACRRQRYLVFSIDSDVCFYPEEQRLLARSLQRAGVPCQHITVHSNKGHDAFLLDPELFAPHMDYTLHHRW